MIYALRLQLHLEEPLLVTGVANGEENSSVSLNYVPGSAVRGACVAGYLHRFNGSDLATDMLARRLFFNDEVRFLNGYLAQPTDTARRALPRPLSWHMDKDHADNNQREVRDYALEEAKKFDKSKGEGRAFFWPGEMQPRLMQSPHRWTNVHNATIEDPMLKKEGESNVFRYEALAREQDFVAYVLAEEKSLLEEVEKCLPSGPLHLGGSLTAGYGLVTFRVAWESNWQESVPDYAVDEWTIITLLSDAVLRDKHGRATINFHEALCLSLNKTIPAPRKQFARACLVGGFNRKWGLPLPQQWAVAMGSTFVYATDDLDLRELEELLEQGLGVRRSEGYGRVGVNLNGWTEFRTVSPGATAAPPQTLSTTSASMAASMARRRLMRGAEIHILNHLKEIDFENEHGPQNAQLSRLRLVVRQAQRNQNLSLIPGHLEALKKPAANQFAGNRLKVPGESNPVTWEKWLRDRAKKNDGLTQIGLNPTEIRWQIAGRPPVIDDALQTEVTCQLVEALLRRALKEAK